MKHRFFRKPLPIALLLVGIVSSIMILTNLWSSAEKYYESIVNRANGFEYRTVLCARVGMQHGDAVDTALMGEYKASVENAVDRLTGLDGNVSLSAAGNIGDVDAAYCNIYLAVSENVPLRIESSTESFENGNGAYVGNLYKNYVNDGKIRLFNDYFQVDGILASGNLDSSRDVMLKYRDMPAASRESMISGLTESCLYDEGFIVTLESEALDEADIMKEFEAALNGVSGISYEWTEPLEEKNTEAYKGLFVKVKDIMLLFAVLVCLFVMFQTMVMYLGSMRRDIIIQKIYGMSSSQIFKPVLCQVAVLLLAGMALSLVINIVIYSAVNGYRAVYVVRYWTVSAVSCAVFTLLMLFMAYVRVNRGSKNIVAEIAGSEV